MTNVAGVPIVVPASPVLLDGAAILRVLVDGVDAARSPTLVKITIPFESRKPPAPPETRPTPECQ